MVRKIFRSETACATEVAWYQRRPLACMPTLLEHGSDYIVLPYAGEPIGPPGSRSLFVRYPFLGGWCARVLKELRHQNVSHNDIHPGNILVLDGQFTLIDWDEARNGASAVDAQQLTEMPTFRLTP